MASFRVAGVQMDIQIGNPQANLERIAARLSEAVDAGAQLTVFPECTTTGYCFESLNEAKRMSETVDGHSVSSVKALCRDNQTMVVFGFLESAGDQIFNSLVLVGPSGLMGIYRKIHLPYLGVDRFTTPGNRPFEVIETPSIRIGLNICYDSAFPEAARSLALQGADLIALPTNWPPTSSLTADIVPNTRALENHVYFMAVNRIGTERGFEFVGKSKICNPCGESLAFANHARETILYGDIDPEFARQKHIVSQPGQHEIHRMNDRRPEAYDQLTKSRDW